MRRQLETWLVAALTHLDPPLHHGRASRLLDRLLVDYPDDLVLLLCRGHITSAAELWAEAFAAFDRVQSLATDPMQALDAREERAWALLHIDKQDEARDELQAVVAARTAGSPPPLQARAHWRLGKCYWKQGGQLRSDEAYAYAEFAAAVRLDPSFAPAFTSLGTFFLDIPVPADRVQASKCLQRAFELDPRQDDAARLLVADFAADRQWDLVELVARRVLAGHAGSSNRPAERAAVGSRQSRRLAWAWQAVGAAEMAQQHYDAAITAFQHALRGQPTDVDTFLQLGQAYRRSGKHIAALKTFARVLRLDPDCWPARFAVAEVQRSVGLYEAALSGLDAVLEQRSDEPGVRQVRADLRLSRARQSLRDGFRTRAERELSDVIASLIGQDELASSPNLKIVADTLHLLGQLGQYVDVDADHAHLDELGRTLQLLDHQFAIPILGSLQVARLARDQVPDLNRRHLAFAALTYKARLGFELTSPGTAGPAWADLALATYRLREHADALGLDDPVRSAIQSIRLALHREPRNPALWTALAIFTFDASPELAQHALIRAIEQAPKSAATWTHLGAFYLVRGESELANKAFLRAQVLDPEATGAWLGQAALAEINGDAPDVAALVEHAWLLSDGSIPECDLALASVVFARVHDQEPGLHDASAVSPALFALARFLATPSSSSPVAQLLLGLLSERAGLAPIASTALAAAAADLEEQYEASESDELAQAYLTANVNLGRVGLASDYLSGASEAYDSALALTDDADADSRLRAQALLGRGVAAWRLGELENALEDLTAAMNARDELTAGQAQLLAARAKWAAGETADAQRTLQELAASTAYEKVRSMATATLAAAAVLADQGAAAADALSAHRSQTIDRQLAADPEGVTAGIVQAQALLRGDVSAAVDQAARLVHGDPAGFDARDKLNDVLNTLSDQRCAVKHTDGDARDRTQRAVHAEPWRRESWIQCTSYC